MSKPEQRLDNVVHMLEDYVRKTHTACESFASFSREITRVLARTALELKKLVDGLVRLATQIGKHQNSLAAITRMVMMKAVPSDKMKNRLGSDGDLDAKADVKRLGTSNARERT